MWGRERGRGRGTGDRERELSGDLQRKQSRGREQSGKLCQSEDRSPAWTHDLTSGPLFHNSQTPLLSELLSKLTLVLGTRPLAPSLWSGLCFFWPGRGCFELTIHWSPLPEGKHFILHTYLLELWMLALASSWRLMIPVTNTPVL